MHALGMCTVRRCATQPLQGALQVGHSSYKHAVFKKTVYLLNRSNRATDTTKPAPRVVLGSPLAMKAGGDVRLPLRIDKGVKGVRRVPWLPQNEIQQWAC